MVVSSWAPGLTLSCAPRAARAPQDGAEADQCWSVVQALTSEESPEHARCAPPHNHHVGMPKSAVSPPPSS